MTSDGGAGGVVFAALLRDARRSAGLTQAELASKAGVGVRTVRDLERGRAARPQRTTVELLAAALGLDGDRRARFVAVARGPATPERRPATLALPRSMALIGRQRELTGVGQVLGRPGVVTLVGLAGVGKSSLAIAVAHQVESSFPGGVAGIAVTEDATDADMLASVATVFGVGRAVDLAARLAAPALLVVDGVERSPAVATAVRWLRRTAPQLRVLAAGRRPVGVPDEFVYPLEPLEVPPEDIVPELAAVAGYPAAALFLARLAEVRREPPIEAEVPALVTLVRRLGGLPLALELAAARGRVLDVNQLLHRYGDRLLDLGRSGEDGGAGGDVGLRAAVAGSYGLLDPAARETLRRLAVFRARWSVELAEDLLPATGDPVGMLDRLVGLGLVTVRGTGPFRFRLLDVVREFALEEARAAGELSGALRRHAEVIARVAARTAPELAGATMPAAVNRLDHLAADLWAALTHAAGDDPHTALCLASKLPRWWRFRGRDVRGREWLRRLLDDPRTAGADRAVRAWARLGVAQLAQEHGAGQDELPAAEAALAEFQELGSITGELAARNLLCSLWMAGGGYDEARRHGEAVLALATRTERIRDMAVAQNNLTWHEIRVGDLAAARRRLAAADRLAAQCGELRLRVLARANLAEVARVEGRYEEAVTIARAAAPLLEELGDPGHRRRVTGIIGLAYAQAGRLDEAFEVLAELPSGPPGGIQPDGIQPDGIQAAVEGWIALHRGSRELAAEWFAAAASASAGRYDARELVEAFVGLAASCSDADLPGVYEHLAEVCRQSGITLLPHEELLLHERGWPGPVRGHGAGGAPQPPG